MSCLAPCSVGSLDTEITIQTRTASTDSIGSPTSSFATLQSPWASMRYLKGTELEDAQRVAAHAEVQFRCRYSSDLAAVDPGSHRLLVGAVVHEILAVTPIPGGRPEWLEILTRRSRD